jgi:hypothetical protein
MLCLYSYGTKNCWIEEYAEIYSAYGNHPTVNAPVDGNGINFANTMIRTAPNNWVFWNDTLYPSSENPAAPYVLCWTNTDWNFRAPRDHC